MQSERRDIDSQSRSARTSGSSPPRDLLRETRYSINDWVLVTKFYRGFQGTIGQIVELSGAFVHIRGEIGPGAGVIFRKGVQNIIRVDPPTVNLDRELPTPRPSTAQ